MHSAISHPGTCCFTIGVVDGSTIAQLAAQSPDPGLILAMSLPFPHMPVHQLVLMADSRMAPTSGRYSHGPCHLLAGCCPGFLFFCPDHPCSHGQPQRDSQNHKSEHVPPLRKALSWLPVALCLKPTLLPVPGELTWSVLLPTSSSSLPPSDMYSLMHMYGVPTVC